jgi:malonyl CoA-acyl carrier protein transacylase
LFHSGQLQWVVREKVTAYGQNLILFCPVDNLTFKSASDRLRMTTACPSVLYVPWYFTLESFENVFTSRIIDLGPTDHLIGLLQQLSTGQNQSTPKYLLHDDVFKESK